MKKGRINRRRRMMRYYHAPPPPPPPPPIQQEFDTDFVATPEGRAAVLEALGDMSDKMQKKMDKEEARARRLVQLYQTPPEDAIREEPAELLGVIRKPVIVVDGTCYQSRNCMHYVTIDGGKRQQMRATEIRALYVRNDMVVPVHFN